MTRSVPHNSDVQRGRRQNAGSRSTGWSPRLSISIFPSSPAEPASKRAASSPPPEPGPDAYVWYRRKAEPVAIDSCRSPIAPGDGRYGGASWTGRGGFLRRRGHRPRPSPAQHRRRRGRTTASVERRRDGVGRLQRRDLQLCRTPRRAREQGALVSDAFGHGSHRACLRGMGGCQRHPVPRHVRVRAVGREGAPSAAGARSRRHQAALLRGAARGRLGVWIGDQIDPARPRSRCLVESRGARCLPDAALCAGSSHDLS